MKTKLKLKSVALIVFSLFLFAFAANAQEAAPVPIFAKVNVVNAKVVSSQDNLFKIFFDIKTGAEVQPGMKYALRLMRADNGVMVDQKVYDESLTLYANQSITKEIEYLAPQYFKGKFTLLIMAENEVGFLLSLNRVDEIELNGDGKFVEIIPESCYLTIEGEVGDKKYNTRQGVDITESENLLANCQLYNHLETEVNLNPNFKTWERNAFGKLVSLSSTPTDSIVLKPGEKKPVIIPLPKANNPQAYDVELSFNSDGKAISNAILFHYVVRGASATIQNLMLDKSFYEAGEIANLSFVWSGSADNFPGSRGGGTILSKAILEVSILNSEGKACSENLQKELLADSQETPIKLAMKMETICQDLVAKVTIKDENGKVLASRNISLKSQSPEVSAVKENKPVKSFSKIGYLIAIILTVMAILAIILVIYFRKKNKGIINIIFLFVLMGTLLVLLPGQANAGAYLKHNIDKSVYEEGTVMYITSTVFFAACGNENTGLSYWAMLYVDGVFAGGGPRYSCNGTGLGDYICSDSITSLGWWTYSHSAGDYVLEIRGCQHTQYIANLDTLWDKYGGGGKCLYGGESEFFKFSIVDSVVNGTCNQLTNGELFATKPTTNLCSTGTPTVVSGTGPWTWTCNGSGGGTNSLLCNANIGYNLKVTKEGDTVCTTSSIVKSDPFGILCGNACSKLIIKGPLTLSTALGIGCEVSLTGDCTSSSGSCNLILDKDKAVTATFSSCTLNSNCSNPPTGFTYGSCSAVDCGNSGTKLGACFNGCSTVYDSQSCENEPCADKNWREVAP